MSFGAQLLALLPEKIRPRGNAAGKITAQDLSDYLLVVAQAIDELEQGTNAGKFRPGEGAPTAELGLDTDVYLDFTTLDLYEKVEGEWKLRVTLGGANGGGAKFAADFLAVYQMGKYGPGQMVPAAGKTAPEVLLDCFSGRIYPAYATAGLSLQQSAPQYVEAGTTLTNTLTATFTRGDAGALGQIRIKKGSTLVGTAGSSSPLSRESEETVPLGTVTYQAFADYAAGTRKLITPDNTPDDRPAAVRNPGAPQAAETDMPSNEVSITGLLQYFAGPAAADATTAAAVRALPQKGLVNGGFVLNLATGNVHRRFVVAVPADRTLVAATDAGNQGANVLPFYVLQVLNSVPDVGGTARAYKVYQMTVSGPFDPATTHVLTFA